MQVVPMETSMEPPKLKGINPGYCGYGQLLCPHGKPGNGWHCREPGCSGEGLCEHKKQKPACKECTPTLCPLCNKVYSQNSIEIHLLRAKVHADVPMDERHMIYSAAWEAHRPRYSKMTAHPYRKGGMETPTRSLPLCVDFGVDGKTEG